MEETPRFHLHSDYTSDPLRGISSSPFQIDDYLLKFSAYPKITFVGDTYAGKNQIIKSLVYTLGGVYQEDKSEEDRGRTRKDKSYLFFEFGESRKTGLLTLQSVAGDLLRSERYYEYHSLKDSEIILVMKNMKSSTFTNQWNIIEPFLIRNGIRQERIPLVITRASGAENILPRRLRAIDTSNFSKVYFVDNPTKREYPLSSFSEANAELVVDRLSEKFEQTKIIYFGKEEIPARLKNLVVPWTNQFEISPTGALEEERLSPEEGLFRTIFLNGTNIKV